MLQYMDDHFGKRPSLNEADMMELEYLRSEVKQLHMEVYGKTGSAGESTGESERKESSSDSEGDDEVADDVGTL